MQEIATENSQMSEEEKAAEMQRIQQKINNGEKLTAMEMAFIRRYYPEMYPRVMRVQAQRQALESRLKQAKSKQEVEQIYSEAMSSIAEEDPDKSSLQAAYTKAYTEYKETDRYKSLPEKEVKNKKSSVFKVYVENENIDELEKEKRLIMQPEFDISG
jgi:hypothetical protein